MYLIHARSFKGAHAFYLAISVYFSSLLIHCFGWTLGACASFFVFSALAHCYYYSHAGWSFSVVPDLTEQQCRRNISHLEVNAALSSTVSGALILLHDDVNVLNSWTIVMSLIAMHIALQSTTLPLIRNAFQIQVGLIGAQVVLGLLFFSLSPDEAAFSAVAAVFCVVLFFHGRALQRRTRLFIEERNNLDRIRQDNEHSKMSAMRALEHKVRTIENMSLNIQMPLHVINNTLDVFEGGSKEFKTQSELAEARLGLKSIQHLLDGISDAKKISQGTVIAKAAPLCLVHFIQDQIDLFRLHADQKQIELVFDFDDNVNSFVYVDSMLLSQVVGHLLSNALRYTLNGKVAVCLHVERATRFTDDVLDVRITVKDTGQGISDVSLIALKQKFSTSPFESLHGETLHVFRHGLDVVHKVLHDHFQESCLNIVSKLDVGTSIDVQFVLPRCDTFATPQSLAIVDEPDPHKGVALLVDDTDFILRNTEKIIKRFIGMDCVTASSGEEAILLSEKQRFDLILMDCHMEDMTGFEATAHLREIELRLGYEHQPIIMVSADGTEECKELAASVGANDHLLKPFDSMDLKAIARKYIELKRRVDTA